MHATLFLAVAALTIMPALAARQVAPAPASRPAADTASISGRVLDGVSSRPIIGATVEVRAGMLRSRRVIVTDPNGKYEVPSLPPGDYTIRVDHSDHVSTMSAGNSPLGPRMTLALGSGEAVRSIDFRLERAAIIRGRVIDQTGQPLPHANVVAHGGARTRSILIASTDEQGDYELRVPAGTFVIEGVTLGPFGDRLSYAPTYYPGVSTHDQAAALSVSPGDRLNGINIPLLPNGVSFAGRVLLGGAAAEGVIVTLVSSPAGVLRRALTEPDGSIRFAGVKPGRYVVFARAGISMATLWRSR